MITRILGYLLLLLTLTIVTLNFYENTFLTFLSQAVTWCLLVAAVFTTRSFGRLVASVLMVAGILLFLWNGSSAIGSMFSAITFNVGIIAIMASVPLIGIAIRVGGYLRAIKQKTLLERDHGGRSRTYRISNLIVISLAPFLNVGAIYITKDIAFKALDKFHQKRLGMLLFRGFATSFYWSPFAASVILITDLMETRWSSIFGYLLIGVVIHLLLSWALFKITAFRDDEWVEQRAGSNVTTDPKRINQKIGRLVLIMTALVALAVALEMVTGWSMVVVIIVLAFGYCFFWMLALQKAKRFLVAAFRYFGRSFLQVRNEIMLFVSAGFFGSALSQSPLHEHVDQMFVYIGELPTLWFVVILFAVFIGVGQLGIHAVVLVTLIGNAVDGNFFPDNPLFLPIVLVFGIMLYNQTSPFSAITVITANLFKINPFMVIRKNVLFCGLLFITLTAVLLLIR